MDASATEQVPAACSEPTHSPLQQQTEGTQVTHDEPMDTHTEGGNTENAQNHANGNGHVQEAVAMECDSAPRAEEGFILDLAGETDEYTETFDAELAVRQLTVKKEEGEGVEREAKEEGEEDESEEDSGSDASSEESEEVESSEEDESDSDSDSDMLDPSMLTSGKILEMLEDEDVNEGPLKTKNELLIDQLPPEELPPPLAENAEMLLMGKVISIVDHQIVVQATERVPTVDLDTALYLARDQPLGKVFDVLGQVGKPFYSLRAQPIHMEQPGDFIGRDVFYCPNMAGYVMPAELRKYRGTDASGTNDEEVNENELEFSDDEQEAAAKRAKKQARGGRGGGSMGGDRIPPGGRGDGRGWRGRGDGGNRGRGRGGGGFGYHDRDSQGGEEGGSWLGKYERGPAQQWGPSQQNQSFRPQQPPQQQENYGPSSMGPPGQFNNYQYNPQAQFSGPPPQQSSGSGQAQRFGSGPFAPAMNNGPMPGSSPWDNPQMFGGQPAPGFNNFQQGPPGPANFQQQGPPGSNNFQPNGPGFQPQQGNYPPFQQQPPQSGHGPYGGPSY